MKIITRIPFSIKNLTATLLLFLISQFVVGQSITSLPYSKTDNFDTYNPTSSTTATSTIPAGWTYSSTSAAYNGRGTGTATAGGFIGYGASTDFSLGALPSGSNTHTYTVSFTNNSGTTITSLTFSWDYEQWRYGAANTSGWDVTGTGQLAANATLNAKDFSGVAGTTAGTTGGLTTPVASFTLSGLSITNGQSFGLTWVTTNLTGADNGVSIDNFSISASATAAPTVSTTTASSITVNSASSGGNVTADGGATVTARGVAFGTSANPTTGTSDGTGTGTYTSTLSSLSVNTRYYYRAYATNSVGTAYGTESNFYTLANVPGTLVIGTPTSTTIPVSVNSGTENSNPAITTYAIQETTGGLYVQANGTLSASAVWQTAATWGTVTVTGLSNNTLYTFHAKARNGSSVETAFGGSTSGTTTGPIAPVVSNGSPSGTYNVPFTYSIIATNSPTSYAVSSGTLPAGLTLNTSTGVISGTPTAAGSSSVDVTATNGGGTGTGTLNFTIAKANQSITFATTDTKVYGTADYAPGATSATSGVNAITYSSNTPSVATIVSNQIHIVGFGTTTITASQASSANYNAATANQTLTVTKKGLTITGLTANNKVQDGTTAATLSGTAALSGVVSGDESNVNLTGTPTATFASATPGTAIAVTVTGYSLTGSASANYTLTQPAGLTANITALGAPTATAATGILNNGFTAHWNAVSGASGYVLDAYTQSGGVTEVINQPFTWSTYSLSNGTGGNSGGWSGSVAANTFDIPVWTETSAYKGDNCAKIGTSSARGALTTPTFGSAGNAVLTFRAGAWDGASEQTTLLLEITGGGTLSVPSVTMVKGVFSSYSVNITGATASTQVTFRGFQNSNSRFFLDDIIVDVNTVTTTPVAGSPFSVNAPATSYNVTGLNAATTYYYTVKAVNGSFTTASSNEINLATAPSPVTWNGTSWSNGTGPTASLEAIIAGVYATTPNGEFTAKKLTLNSGSFTISGGDNITVVGEVINNMSAANFIVENNANLLQGGTVSNNTGSITVKRDSAEISRLDYTLWSSPVSGQGLYAFSKFTLPNRFYVYNSGNNTYSNSVGFNLTGLEYPSPLVAPNGVNGTDTNNVQFATATGYLIRTPWDHPTTGTAWHGTFTGTPHNGDVTVTSLTTGLYYAVGNPYPSTINADTFITANGLTDALYFWRKTNLAAGSAYATYTLAGGTTPSPGTGAGPGDPNSTIPNGTIQVGQGFIAKAASSTISFTNSMRTANNDNQFFKDAVTLPERSRIWLNLTNASGLNSQTMIAYMANATSGIDAAIDGKYINDSETALTSVIDGQEFAVQGRALPFINSDIVPLGFKTETAGNFTISLYAVDGLFSDSSQVIYLKDNQTGTINNLSAGAYTFDTTAGTFNNRFEVVYQPQLVNPTFTANNVIIYSKENGFVVNSGNFVMSSIKVFDIRGRLIEEKKAINANEATIKGGLSNGVLLVQITTAEGVTITKKVIR